MERNVYVRELGLVEIRGKKSIFGGERVNKIDKFRAVGLYGGLKRQMLLSLQILTTYAFSEN